jgi:hypothetical protein
MRDQYAGDVSDLLKFAFLRTLSAAGKTIGVGWYYNPAHDGRPDGLHREYCDEPKWASFDLTLSNALRKLPEQSVAALEKLPIWPMKTRFHRVPVPSTGNRQAWACDMVKALQEASIIFLDPDNCVGRASERHATIAEVAAMRRPGRAVVLIKFPGHHRKHAQQIDEYHKMLRDQAGAVSVVTVRTCVWLQQPRSRWFTIIDADDVLVGRAKEFAHRLNRIDKCSADVVCGPSSAREDQTRIAKPTDPYQVQPLPKSPTSYHTRPVGNLCPECGHQFKGSGFDGIDAHWRAKHEAIMPYKEAWPLVKAGNYHRQRPGQHARPDNPT